MQQEIEAKFLDTDHEVVRQRLKELGADCEQPMRLMRRKLFDYPDQRFQKIKPTRRLRVRDEGDKVAINFKAKNDTNYPYEIDITVGSFDDTVKLLEVIGLECYSTQESKRETWHYKNCEVVLDVWPWLNPYIEVEGPDEESIQAVSKELGFDWSAACFGSVDTAYRHQYPGMTKQESIGDLPEVRFDVPLPDYLKQRQPV